ncbi:glycosyltransferase [Paracoccus suum]|uniref:Glycosyltransferase n=1 Tax=Paracoccus suum TaxID=2259340 RepID=A0A344PJN2_9RHOB|nr:glycosyltransferase [Paracoccus suum]AXC49587.1 glycosyltransferase [Paracoccus suum]
MTTAPRVAIIAHSHPRLRAGGGEIAAWRQFDRLRARGVDAWFLGVVAGDDGLRLGGTMGDVTAFDPRDLALRTGAMDPFLMEQPDAAAEDRLLATILRFDAGIYHFHHVWNIGAGVIRRLRVQRPQARLVLTLHEMAPICALWGQMVRADGGLCDAATPLDCAACLPAHAPLSFAIRRARMLEVLGLMDVLIAPSRFLAGRYEDWGVPAGRIQVIENGLPSDGAPHPAPIPQGAEADALSRRFAFFGNATPTKGLDVLANAAARLAVDPAAGQVTIEAHGVDAAGFARALPGFSVPPTLALRGRYRPAEATARMARQGWVIVPSTWWENAPVVIDEARAARRPVIASDIGGMAEKTAGWGLQFPVGDAGALASLIATLAGDGARWAALAAAVPPPASLDQVLNEWASACGITLRE